MAINKKFIHFNTKKTFQQELEEGNILNTSLVFIADAKQLYVNGTFFSENSLFDLANLLEIVKSEGLSEEDTIPEAVVKLYKQLQEIEVGTDEIVKLLASEIYALETELLYRLDDTDEVIAAGLANLNSRIEAIKVPTKVSQLENDENYAKSADVTAEIKAIPRTYTIDFLSGNMAQEYNLAGAFTIKEVNLANISDVTLHVGTDEQPAEAGTVVPNGSLLTWEITKINNELPAAIGVILTYND